MSEEEKQIYIPSMEQIKAEKERLKLRAEFLSGAHRFATVLMTVAIVVFVLTNYTFQLIRVDGLSMTQTLQNNEIVLTLRTKEVSKGDIITFKLNDRTLIKRVIAKEGDVVDIDEKGNVYVNEEMIEEPYRYEKTFGYGDVQFPYEVPEEAYFVLGDNREVSLDSRYSEVGFVFTDQIQGRVIMRIWPIFNFTIF